MARKLWIALLVVGAGALPGQATTPSARWTAWLGCWQPLSGTATLTCIVPGRDGVQRLSVVGDSITSRETLIADGKPRPADRDGCQGEENASWSKTGTRVYLNGHFSCPGAPDVESTRLFAIAPGGEWVEEEQLRSGGGAITRETRYRDAGTPASLPKSIARALQQRSMAVAAARAAASAPITSADVADAVSFVDTSLVRSWLNQTGTRLGGTTVFAQAPSAYTYSYGLGGAYIGPSYAPYSPPTQTAAPMQMAPPQAYPPDVSSSAVYSYPLAYGYPYYYGLWSAPEIVVPGAARPRAPKYWGLATQPPPARPAGHPGIRK